VSGDPNPDDAAMKPNTLTPELIEKIDAYWRAAN
jgi:hypothetical protein